MLVPFPVNEANMLVLMWALGLPLRLSGRLARSIQEYGHPTRRNGTSSSIEDKVPGGGYRY